MVVPPSQLWFADFRHLADAALLRPPQPQHQPADVGPGNMGVSLSSGTPALATGTLAQKSKLHAHSAFSPSDKLLIFRAALFPQLYRGEVLPVVAYCRSLRVK